MSKRQAALRAAHNLMEAMEIDSTEPVKTKAMQVMDLPDTGEAVSSRTVEEVNGANKKKMQSQDFDVQAKMFLQNLDTAYQTKVDVIKLHYKKVNLKIRKEILQLTLGQYLMLRQKMTEAGAEKKDVQIPCVSSSKKSSSMMRVSLARVDGNVIISASAGSTTAGAAGDAAEAAAATDLSQEVLATPANRRSELVLRKPSDLSNPLMVRAKFDQSKPVNPLRWAVANELAMSLQGSPVLPSGVGNVKMVNLNVPLTNGKVMSIFPHPMTDTRQFSGMLNKETLQQLQCIEENIGLVRRLCQEDADANRKSLVPAHGPQARRSRHKAME